MINKHLTGLVYEISAGKAVREISGLISNLILLATGKEELVIPEDKRYCNLDVYVPSSDRYIKYPLEILRLFVNDNGLVCVDCYDHGCEQYFRNPLKDRTLDDNVAILNLVRTVIGGLPSAKERFVCPCCGSEEVVYNKWDESFLCDDCRREYRIGDVRLETLRHALSPHLCETTEEKPLPVDVRIGRYRRITGCFHDPDAKIWFHVEKDGKPLEPKDIDSFSITTVRRVLKQIER